MPRLVPRLLRALAVTVACGSLSACVVPSGQPYGSSYYSAQIYSTPVYRGGYYGPGSGTGYGGLYAAPVYRGYYGPGSGTGYGGYYAPRGGYYGPGSGSGYGGYLAGPRYYSRGYGGGYGGYPSEPGFRGRGYSQQGGNEGYGQLPQPGFNRQDNRAPSPGRQPPLVGADGRINPGGFRFAPGN